MTKHTHVRLEALEILYPKLRTYSQQNIIMGGCFSSASSTDIKSDIVNHSDLQLHIQVTNDDVVKSVGAQEKQFTELDSPNKRRSISLSKSVTNRLFHSRKAASEKSFQ